MSNYYYEIAEGWVFHGRLSAGFIDDYENGIFFMATGFKGGDLSADLTGLVLDPK